MKPQSASIKIDNWWEYLRGVQSTYPLSYGPQSDGSLSPEYVIETLGKMAGPDAVYVAGVGQHQMWAAQFISYENPRTWINSGGLGTMGFAIPAAMGAKFARPEAEGIRTLIAGICAATGDDEERLARGGAVFEDLHSHFRRRRR